MLDPELSINNFKPVYPEKGGGLAAKVSLSRSDLKEGDGARGNIQVYDSGSGGMINDLGRRINK